MELPRWRERLADALGLLAILLVLLDYFRPALLFLPTVTAGGDTPCHYPTFVWFKEHLLPQGRLHGWYPGAYLGHPLLLYYFPLPFLIMSALHPIFGMPVAFKLGTALPVFLLPLLTYAAFRLMGFRFPGPLIGAGAAAVFLFHEDNPIWGGTIASTLTGEFSYTYGIGLAVLFLGLCYRAYTRGRGPLGAALLLGLVAFAHGYAVLWAGLATTYFLFGSRRPWRTLGFLAVVAAGAFATAGILLVPLLSDWGYTTPYSDPWITVTTHGLVPPFLGPLFALAALGLLGTILLARRAGGPDHRLLFLGYASLIGAALAAAGPALGVIDVRFVPFAQLGACLLGAAPWAFSSSGSGPRTWPPWASFCSACSTGTPARGCAAPGSTGTTPGSRPRSCGPPSARWQTSCAATWATRGWRSSTAASTSARAPSACTRPCPTSRDGRPSRACTTRPACPPTRCTTWPPSSGPPRPTRSRRSSTRGSTPPPLSTTCGCST